MRTDGVTNRRKRRLTRALTALLLGEALVLGSGVYMPKTVYAQEASNQALQEQRLNTWYAQAIQSINDGDYKNAIMCLDGCMIYCTRESNPVLYADIYMKRGYCSMMLKKYDDALEALNTALETDPELTNAMLIRASVYSETGRLEAAANQLEKYAEASGDNSVLETVAALYEAMGDPEKAFESYQEYAQKTTETEAEKLLLCGTYQMQRGAYEEAIDCFGQCLEQEEPADGVYYNRGLCYMALGDYESAISDLGQSVETESFANEALYTKGTCEMTILAYDDAIADFTRCIEQDADPDNSRINRGICLLLSGQSEEALADFNECVEKDINADEARFYRSFVNLADEAYEEALEDLTTCIDHGYDLPASYMQRAQVYKEMGNDEAYRADMEASQKVQQDGNNGNGTEEAEEALTEALTE